MDDSHGLSGLVIPANRSWKDHMALAAQTRKQEPTEAEEELYNAIMKYAEQKGLSFDHVIEALYDTINK